MTPKQFQTIYPQIYNWIQQTFLAHSKQAKTVSSLGFSRLPLYFSQEFLGSAKCVAVETVPIPPLSKIGLNQFAEFERGDYDGITYLDTFFLKQSRVKDEGLYFHELIHVLQWRLLGPERFLAAYADGLERFGYRQSPLEIMAYNAETTFRQSAQPFNVENLVAEQMRQGSIT